MVNAKFSKAGFVRSYLLPALWLFVIPLLGYAFALHAQAGFDQNFINGLTKALASDAQIAAPKRLEILTFYKENPASALCAAGAEGQKALPSEYANEACGDFAQLRWIALSSLGCIALGLLSALFAMVCVAASFVSRTVQYLSFVAGFQFLRVASAVQVVAQSFVTTMLSFWVTAFYLEVYSIKLIAVVGVVAACAVLVVLSSIFKKPNDKLVVEGELLPRDSSQGLWRRIDEICKRLGTEPPQQIIGGIDDNFFVTEHPVELSSPLPKGRTLFVSLSLLKRLSKSEADAILAHEMAHFSGGDTQYSKQLAPVVSRFSAYLEALYSGGLSRPVFYFMFFYWSAFQISLGKTRRERELRADKIAADLTSPSSVANSLLKVAAYSRYRARVEAGLFEQNRRHSNLDIAHSMAVGFVEYARGEALTTDLKAEDAFPHPFDSHPGLLQRMANVGAQVPTERVPDVVVNTSVETWFNEIGEAERIEGGLWDAYEQRFKAVHEEVLAYRYLPATPEGHEHVEKYFPPREFAQKEGTGTLKLDCLALHYHAWSEPVAWTSTTNVRTDDRTFQGKYLIIERKDADGRAQKLEVSFKKLADEEQVVLDVIGRYYGRALAAKEHVLVVAAQSEASSAAPTPE